MKVLSKWLEKERKEIKFSASDVNKLPLDREIKNPLAVVAAATDMLTITDSHSHCVYQVSITNNGACLRGTCTVLMKLCNSQFQTPLPRPNPGAFDFFEKIWSNSPLCCLSNALPVRTSKEGQIPHPPGMLKQLCNTFFHALNRLFNVHIL